MHTLLIYSEKVSPRLEYVCRFVFNQQLGLQFSVTKDFQEFKLYQGAKLLYASVQNEDYLKIEPCGLLFETGIKTPSITTGAVNGITVPFFTGTGLLPFDVFSAVFYLVTRYEEYLPFVPNQYGQFKATDSLAYKLGFLDKPVVDIWIDELKNKLYTRYPSIAFKQVVFKAIYTYDIDVAYKYKGRSLFITCGNVIYDLLSLHFTEAANRLKVLIGLKKDPFDTYTFIQAQQKRYNYNVIFFHLLGKKNSYNRNISANGKNLQSLIQLLSKQFTTGIHPSYYTDADYELMLAEKKLLEKIISRPVNISRQHYLRLQLPLTFENLISAGITDDYTVAFAEMPGFRAGTSKPFTFYNIIKEEEINIVLHPAACMDVTFSDDLKMEPENSIKIIKQLINAVKAVNGNFIIIWHNNTLSNLNGWTKMSLIHDEIGTYLKTNLP
jgi:hypothetical protein